MNRLCRAAKNSVSRSPLFSPKAFPGHLSRPIAQFTLGLLSTTYLLSTIARPAIANPVPTPTQPSPLLPTRNVLNGGFEQPIQAAGAGSGVLEGYGTTPPIIWQTTEDTAPYANKLEIWNGPATGSGGPVGGGHAGAQYAEVNAASNGSIYQDVCILPGESVDWSLWHAARDSGQTNSMQVSITDPTLWTGKIPPVTQLYTSPNLSTTYSQGWQQKNGNWLSTVAAIKPLRFAFQAIQGSSGFVSLGNFVDDIALDLSPVIDFLPTDAAKNINLASTIEGDTTNNYYVSLRINGKMQTAGTVTINLTGLNASRNFTVGSVLKGGATIAGLTATKNGTAITLSIPAGTYNPNLPTDYIHIPIDFSDTITQPNDNLAFTLSNPTGGGGISGGTLATIPPLSVTSTSCLGATRTIVNAALADDDLPIGGLAGISGTIFEDYGTGTTGDNIKQGMEAGISGVDVTLYLDDGDQVFEPGAGDSIAGTSQISSATGAYNFPGLPNGIYWVKANAAAATNRIYGGLTSDPVTNLPNPRILAFNGVSVVENFPFDAGHIGVAKIQSNVDATKATIDFVIKNYGPVTLTNIELIDNLDQAFLAGNYTIAAAPSILVAPTLGSTVTPATNFDGSTNQNLLNSTNSQLKVGESVTIRVEVNVTNSKLGGDTAGNYLNNAIVNAKTPSGIVISDESIDGKNPDPDADGDPTNDSAPTTVSVIQPTVGGICASPNGLVFSGGTAGIYAVDVQSGKSRIMTGSALATVNGAATDHNGHLVYYAENNSIYAWDPIINQHITITNQFQTILGKTIPGFDLGSGGAAFYNGSLYQGVDTGIFEIYKIDFVPGSNGRTIQSIAPLGIANLVASGKLSGGLSWGDLIISDTGLILANGNGNQYFWSYDLNTNKFTDLADSTITENSQLAKDGQGRLWGLSNANTVFQVQVSATAVTKVAGTTKSTGNHRSLDAAECAVGLNTIGDRVWSDVNGNGLQDPGELGIANVTVDLYWDLNDNGVIDTDEPVLETQTTDANGAYDFKQLLFGGYVVKVTDRNNVLQAAILTTSTAAFPVLLPTGKNDYNDADFGYRMPPPGGISGTVFEDPNYGGGAGRNLATPTTSGRDGATVELYKSDGTYISNIITSGGGKYTFTGIAAGDYKIRVVNSTVTSSRPGAVAGLLPIQTFRTDATTGTVTDVTDHVGGEKPKEIDAPANTTANLSTLDTATQEVQSLTTVKVGNAAVGGIDFGYNFDTIVNTNNSGQGSLRQFITNSNTLTNVGLAQVGQTAGKEVSIFMIPDGAAHPGLRAGVASGINGTGGNANAAVISLTANFSITDANTQLDATTQTTNVGDLNPGTVGTGGTVGVDGLPLSVIPKPEVVLDLRLVPTNTNAILVKGGNTVLKGFASYGYRTTGNLSTLLKAAIVVDAVVPDASRATITQLLGGTMADGSDPAVPTIDVGYTLQTAGAVNISNNYFAYNSDAITFENTNGTSVNFIDNELAYNGPKNNNGSNASGIYADQMETVEGTKNITLRGNLVRNSTKPGYANSQGQGIQISYSSLITLENNTFTDNNVYAINASASDTLIRKNIITGTKNTGLGQGSGIVVYYGGPLNTGLRNRITQNSIYQNTKLGIDHQADGVTPNNGTIGAAQPNNGIDYPIVTSSLLSGNDLVVKGYVGNVVAGSPTFANATLEFFIADDDGSNNGKVFSTDPATVLKPHGEGKTYIGTCTTNGSSLFNCTFANVNTLMPIGQTFDPKNITATATDAAGNTSEFSSIPMVNNPNVLLVKRITGINGNTTTFGGDSLAGYIDELTNAYDDNIITIPTQPTPSAPPIDTANWPTLNSFMLGGINGGNIKPNDEVEYTIYFLSAGLGEAKNVLFCDRVPSNVTFMPTAFNSATPATGGLGGDRGILSLINGTTAGFTNVADGDAARYFPPNSNPTAIYPNLNCGGSNTNGAVVINLGNLPNATAPGTPTGAFGFVRFKGRVK
jgi:uncharacterized repeat protein (TIGR01451 family)